jgi:tripartite-type tricarboxylate transporter receptor subunit TctC
LNHNRGVTADVDMSLHFEMLVPTATPADIVAGLNAERVKALRSPGIKEQFAKQGFEPLTGSRDEFNTIMMTRFGELMRAGNIWNIQAD